MKKFILIIVCVVVLSIFISMNYLLWDRESKIQSYESLNYSKNTSIDALSEQIKSLKEQLSAQDATINNLQNQNTAQTNGNTQLEIDKLKLQADMQAKNSVIDQLKQKADFQVQEAIIKKWVESINKGKYADSYNLMNIDAISSTGIKSQDQFVSYFQNNITGIKLSSLDIDLEGVPGNRSGDLIFKAVLDVKKTDNSNDSQNLLFNHGQNTKYFTMIYNAGNKKWLISEIANSL
ncbi:MAG: hypothetical protein Q8920_10490 [Bacillota bacterium]|nr:hypothetical protein [Bacillota bacterium]